MYDVGLPVHDADSTTFEPTFGLELLASSEQTGIGSVPPPPPPPPPGPRHSTSTATFGPVPELLPAGDRVAREAGARAVDRAGRRRRRRSTGMMLQIVWIR
jgi:hypothetical protein